MGVVSFINNFMYEYKIKEITKVVDGDTLDVIFDLGFSMFIKQRVRLDGIDTPELFSGDENEKKFGLDAKEFVEKWISEQKEIVIKTTKDDKYGRILGKLYGNDEKCLNTVLIESGYAWVYPIKEKNYDILLERRKA